MRRATEALSDSDSKQTEAEKKIVCSLHSKNKATKTHLLSVAQFPDHIQPYQMISNQNKSKVSHFSNAFSIW